MIPDKSYIPDCLVASSDDTAPVVNTFSFDLNDKYNFNGLDDSVGSSRKVVRSSNHVTMMKPNDDAPEFRG